MHVPSRALLRAGLVALVGSLLIVAFLVVTRGERARAEAAAARPSQPSAPASVPVAAAPSAVRASPDERARAEAATPDAGSRPAAASARASSEERTGEIVPPRSAAGHRVFVDGAQVGEGTRAIRVDCGEHRLRIGSTGREHVLSVPCGGSIELR